MKRTRFLVRASLQRWLSALLVGALAAAAIGQETTIPVPSDPRAAERLGRARTAAQQQLDAFIARVNAPGATLGFALPDGRSDAVASGVAQKGGRPMKPDDRLFSGSIGKTYCAVVLMQLVEAGKVKLDDRLPTWFKDEAWLARLPNGAEITLRMLMNHTSGLRDHVWAPEFQQAVRDQPDRVWKPAELIAYILDRPALDAAGANFSYADTNYILVGMIIEKVTGRRYYDLLAERVLRPLRLSDTLPSDRADLPGLVPGYTGSPQLFGTPEQTADFGRYRVNPQFEWTGGGLISSAEDLARFGHAVCCGELMKPESRAAMAEGVRSNLGPEDRYGLGLMLWNSAAGSVRGHAGFFPGYTAMFGHFVDQRVTVSVQLNTDAGISNALLRGLLEQVARDIAGPATESRP